MEKIIKEKVTTQEIALKILKYSVYIVILYFAYEGFMAWD